MAKKITQRKRLSALFVSFTVVIMGAISIYENMSLDYDTVLGTLQRMFPACIVMGFLGWIMGMILDKPRKSGLSSYNKLMMQELMKKDNILDSDISPDISNSIQNTTGNQII